MRAQSLQLCPTLCESMDYSPPDSSVQGILQERILGWVAMPSSKESAQAGDQTRISCVSCIAGRFFTLSHLGSLCNALSCAVLCLATQLCLIPGNPMDCSPPGSSVHGILQARILKRVAYRFFGGSSQLRNLTSVSCIVGGFFYQLSYQGNPLMPQSPKILPLGKMPLANDEQE